MVFIVLFNKRKKSSYFGSISQSNPEVQEQRNKGIRGVPYHPEVCAPINPNLMHAKIKSNHIYLHQLRNSNSIDI